MSDLLKCGSTYFPVTNEDTGQIGFVKSGGTKLQFKDGTIVVYMPAKTVMQYGKRVKRDASISVTYKWGQKVPAMSLIKFKASFGEKFVAKVFKVLFEEE